MFRSLPFTDSDRQFMALAIGAARMGIAQGQTPFGTCIVRDGEVIASEHNQVWLATDSTAHAEIQAIRGACLVLKGIDLSGCDLYSTCEPCPMCFSAIHWACIRRIYYGAGIADARAAGFHELSIDNQTMKRKGRSEVEIFSGLLREECQQLFQEWLSRPDRKVY